MITDKEKIIQNTKQYKHKYYMEHREHYREYKKKYYQEHKEVISKCYQENKEKKLDYNRKWYKGHKEKSKQYRKVNHQQLLEYSRKYRQEHKEEIKQYQKANRQRLLNLTKQWKINHPGKMKEMTVRRTSKRRGLGFSPLNKPFKDSIGHHINKNDIIYIPEELHRSISHSIKTGRNMKEINKLAIKFILKGRKAEK